MAKRIFIVFGHHNYKSGTSFNAAIRDEFTKCATSRGFEIDLINLYEEKQIKFWDGNKPDSQILDYQKRMESSDVIVIMSDVHNYIMRSIVENFIAHTVCPPFAFSYRNLFLDYGYPVPNKLKGKTVIISSTYGGPSFLYSLIFQQIPRRIKKFVFKYLAGCDVAYMRFYSVLPNMPEKVFKKHMRQVRKTVEKL